MELPQFFRLRQSFDAPQVVDINATVSAELKRLDLGRQIKSGQTIAITAGSRGITKIAEILRSAVAYLRSLGAEPLIIPAMGSHGGGTAEGQRQVLTSYGITESFCGCPIRSSMETVEVCSAREGFPVYFDRYAWEADHVLVCGRIKPHTNFVGPIESGLMKMMLIGLGKHDGAKIYHRAIQNYSFDQIVRSVAREVLQKCGVIAGLAIVENQYDQTAIIEAIHPGDFDTREPELLERAKALIPSLPFDAADLLLIDEIGKNISGTGMDTNVIGRKFHDHEAAADETPKIKRIIVRDLTDATHGNATGIGLAEFCHTRVVEKIDLDATRINSLTGGHPTAAMLPLDYPSDEEILEAAFPTIGLTDPPDAKVLWIRNTLDVSELECSTSYLEQVRQASNLDIIVPPRNIPFDQNGDLPWVTGLSVD